MRVLAATTLLLLLPLLPSARAAPTSILIAPGVRMPTVSNGYISGIYSKGKNATQTVAAFRTWIQNGGRGIDTAYECENTPLSPPFLAACLCVPRQLYDRRHWFRP
jgi:hypothetical protein